MLKALIIDDERLARNELRRLLENFPKIQIIGEAANADEALGMIDELEPELLFLDIQMPGKNGFELACISCYNNLNVVNRFIGTQEVDLRDPCSHSGDQYFASSRRLYLNRSVVLNRCF